MDRLRAEHITKSFDGTTIIQDVSLTLHEDELICLLGAVSYTHLDVYKRQI